MNTMMVQVCNPLDAPPDVLPEGSDFQFESCDAGLEWNKEGTPWARPGQFIQYHLWNRQHEIWIIRCCDTRLRYRVAFGRDPEASTQYDLSEDELRAAVREYLGGE